MFLHLFRLKFLCGLFCVLTVSLSTPVFASPSSVEVTVNGVSGNKKKNVEAALGLAPGLVRDGQVDQHWLLRFVDQVPGLAEQALEPFGYYRSEIEVNLQETDEVYLVNVQVAPGVPVRVRELSLRLTGAGSDKSELKKELRTFPLKKGATLRHKFYEKGKVDLQRKAIDLGYLDAAYTIASVTVYPDEDAADIELELVTGERYRFGAVTFDGDLDFYDETFLNRFIPFSEGDVFSHRLLHGSRVSFYQADRFDDVLMVPRIDEAEDLRVPIDVKLVPGKRYSLRPGIGYGTDTGARVSLNYQDTRPFNRPDLYSFEALLAEKTEFLENSYTIPQAGSSENNFIISFGIRHEDFSVYETQIAYAEIEETYSLGSGKTGSLYLRYSREDSDIGSDSFVSYLLTPGIRYYQRSYDDPLNPRKGYQFRLELRGNHDELGSDLTFGQILGAGSFILPLSSRFTLHTRVEAATTIKDDEFSDIPVSMRFFVGGDSSVRGYSFNSRGPRNSDGDVVGGDSKLVGSVELEYSLNDNWGLAVFYDTGSAFNKVTEDIKYIHGAGVGVRRYTLIGPIKLDLAARVGDSNNSLRVHLSVGFDI